MKRFAVLQLSGCAGCEVSLINADAWVDRYHLVYMPLVVSAYDMPEVDILLVSGGVRTDEDLHMLRRAVRRAGRVVAAGTCSVSGGVANLGDRDEVRELFLAEANRHRVPRLLPKSHPIDRYVDVDLYLPGCPPTPELFMAVLQADGTFKASKVVCQECGRTKLRDMKPQHLVGFQQGKTSASGWLSAGEGVTRHLPDQPGLSLCGLLNAGGMSCALSQGRASVCRVPRALRCAH